VRVLLEFWAAFACVAILISVLTPLARRVGLVDRPGGRKRHARPTPVIGGLAIALVSTTVGVMGSVAVVTLLVVGLANSIMFPTIFSLAVDGLGEETGRGSGVLVMAIVGGAVIPVIMGALADGLGYRVAIGSTVLAYGYIGWFARWGSGSADGTTNEANEANG